MHDTLDSYQATQVSVSSEAARIARRLMKVSIRRSSYVYGPHMCRYGAYEIGTWFRITDGKVICKWCWYFDNDLHKDINPLTQEFNLTDPDVFNQIALVWHDYYQRVVSMVDNKLLRIPERSNKVML